MLRKRFRLAVRSLMALLTAGFILGLQPAMAVGSLDNKGTDFIMAFLPNLEGYQHEVEIHLTSEVPTNITIEYPVNSPTFSTTVAATPGTVTTVVIPAAAQVWPIGSVANNAVRAYADDEFVAYLINRATYTSDAALALPVDTMNTEYIVNAPTPSSWQSDFVVVAAYDGTDVTITPAVSLSTGQPAGVPFNVSLNRGEGIQYRSATTGAAGDLTGSVIESSRPVGMINGLRCVNIGDQGACDHVFEVTQPVQTWGDQVLVTNLPLRPSGSIYRIVASQDLTTVSQDGAPIGVINRGEYITTPKLTDSHSFSADKPIFVTQWMSGQPSGGTGDPAFGNVIPFAQYLSEYTFSTVGGAQFADNYVSIIAEDADVGTLTLDGVPVPAASFSPIGATGYSAALVQLSSGAHTTASTGVHGITVEGYNSYDSYLYPGGALFQFINPVGDENAPMVVLTPDADPTILNGTSTDNRPSEDTNSNNILDPGEDLNANGLIDEDTGIFFVELAPGALNLSLSVDPFVPGDGSATFTVQQVDSTLDASGTIVITDGAGNVTTEDVSFGAIPNVIEGVIDIKPGSEDNPINLKSKGVIPVAILGSYEFDVSSIDVSTLSFGPNSAAPAHKAGGHLEDVNDDGYMDLLSHYRTVDTGLTDESMEACVNALTTDGIEYVGCDNITIVPH